MSRRSKFDWVKVSDVEVLNSTTKAGLYLIDGEEIWIPWSQIREDSTDTDGDTGDLWLRRWIADEKAINYEEES